MAGSGSVAVNCDERGFEVALDDALANRVGLERHDVHGDADLPQVVARRPRRRARARGCRGNVSSVKRASVPFASSSHSSSSRLLSPMPSSSACRLLARELVARDARPEPARLPGVTGPWMGTAAPRNTVLANASRSTACESACRNSLRGSHAPRGSLAHLPGRRLKTNESASGLTPSSSDLHAALRLERAQRLDVGRAQRLLHEVDLPGLQAHELRVLIGHDLDASADRRTAAGRRARPSASNAGCARRPAAAPGWYCVSTNGPIDTSSDGGVSGRPALANVPAASAPRACASASSAGCRAGGCPGRTSRERDDHGAGVGRGHGERLARRWLSADGQRAGVRGS